MTFTRTEIPDVVVIEPTVHGDSRGYFLLKLLGKINLKNF